MYVSNAEWDLRNQEMQNGKIFVSVAPIMRLKLSRKTV